MGKTRKQKKYIERDMDCKKAEEREAGNANNTDEGRAQRKDVL